MNVKKHVGKISKKQESCNKRLQVYYPLIQLLMEVTVSPHSKENLVLLLLQAICPDAARGAGFSKKLPDAGTSQKSKYRLQ